jgi:hypothetical protein
MTVATQVCTGLKRPTRYLPDAAALWRSSLRRRSVPVEGVHREITVELAATRHDWEDALHLVAGNYQQRRYETGHTCDLRFTSYHALPDTVVTIAKEHGRVLATMSVFVDNTLLGLPMDDLYAAELRPLRAAGRRLCEAGCLASRDLNLREFMAVFEALIRLVWQHHVAEGGDTVVISCNPRHRLYYTRVLGCEPMGGVRAYAAVENHPAEAFVLHVDRLRQYSPAMYAKIFGCPLPAAALTRPQLPADLVRYFAHHSARADACLVEHVLRHTQTYGSRRRW